MAFSGHAGRLWPLLGWRSVAASRRDEPTQALRRSHRHKSAAVTLYPSLLDRPVVDEEDVAPPATGGRVGRARSNVVLLGLTSSSRTVSVAILPLYLAFELRLSPVQVGLVSGAYVGATAMVRLIGGVVADRARRHKEVAAVGYGTSALCKLGLLAAGPVWAATTAVLLVDRLGKGLRTARDALISLVLARCPRLLVRCTRSTRSAPCSARSRRSPCSPSSPTATTSCSCSASWLRSSAWRSCCCSCRTPTGCPGTGPAL